MKFSDKIDKLLVKNNIKNLRQLANEIEIPYTTLWDYYTNPIRLEKANLTYIKKIANRLNCSVDYLVYDYITDFDNAESVDIDEDVIKIPVLGIIKAGIPIEAQQGIIDYVEIPKHWTKGNKQFFALKISGNSMFPNYSENDIVIFLKTSDFTSGQDCAVMVNGDDATFKKVAKTDNGLLLQPYNLGEYDLQFYSKEEVENLPVKIIGIAKERRTKID